MRSLMRSKSSIVRSTPISRATASRCSTAFVEPPLAATAAIAFSSAGARDDVAREQPPAQDVDDEPAGLEGDVGLRRGLRVDHRRARGAEAQDLEGHGHRVGGELAAARARPGRRGRLELVELVLGHAAGGLRADALEDVEDRDLAAAPAAGRHRAAVEHDAGHVEPREGHDRARAASCRSPRARSRRRRGARG